MVIYGEVRVVRRVSLLHGEYVCLFCVWNVTKQRTVTDMLCVMQGDRCGHMIH